MELTIWLSALAVGALILLLAIGLAGAKALSLGKKLMPFGKQIVNLGESAKKHPEAVKFFTELAKAQQPPVSQPGASKADES